MTGFFVCLPIIIGELFSEYRFIIPIRILAEHKAVQLPLIKLLSFLYNYLETVPTK